MSSSDLKQRLAAILAADVAGYSRLMAADELGTVAALDAARLVFKSQIESSRGRVIDMAGDSVLAVFETATGAVSAALAIQQELRGLNTDVSENRRMRFRIGVHIGDVIEKTDGTIYGDGVNIAARLEGLAEPGGITVSDSVRNAVKGKVGAGFEDQGEQKVKNISEPVRAYRVKIETGPASTPSPVAGERDLSLPDKSSIAVLPFASLSADPNDEFFADGVTEEILNALAQIPGLRVAGRSSAFSFKGRNEDLRAVAAKLNVAAILEGTMRRSGSRLRITAQLIDAGSGYQLWSDRYDRVMEDVFAVQDEIATTIAGRLRLSLAASRDGQHVQPPTRHLGAYELYLKGRALLYRRGLSILEAIDCFMQAVTLDPAYAQAWAGLADGYTTSGYSGFKPAAEVMPRALEAARRALQLDPELAEAHNALACATLLYERDYELAEQEFRRALAQNPNYPQSRAWYGLFLLQWIAGREREAREELARLLTLDPLSGYANAILAFSDFTSGRPAEAVDHARRAIELDPNSYLAQWSLTEALQCNGRHEEAAAAAERALAMSGRHPWALSTLVSIYAAWDKPDNARAVFRELEVRSAREHVQPSMSASAAAAAGDMDLAIAIANRAVEEKDPLFVMLARTWPGYDLLRTDSRFLDVVGRLNLPGWRVAP